MGPPKSARIAPEQVKTELQRAGYVLAEEQLPTQPVFPGIRTGGTLSGWGAECGAPCNAFNFAPAVRFHAVGVRRLTCTTLARMVNHDVLK